MEQIAEFLDNLGYMTFSHEGFWLGLAVVAAVLVGYQLLRRLAPAAVAPVSRFFDHHPLIWLCIPAALLIYFVYVSLGWNLWVSVSDWESGTLQASYGFGGFGKEAFQGYGTQGFLGRIVGFPELEKGFGRCGIQCLPLRHGEEKICIRCERHRHKGNREKASVRNNLPLCRQSL